MNRDGGQKAPRALPGAFILNAGFAACEFCECEGTPGRKAFYRDRVSQKGVGFTSRNNVILQRHGVQISTSQGGGAPSSKLENLKTSKCFMLRVNI